MSCGSINAQTERSQHFMCSYYGDAIDPTIRTAAADSEAERVIQQIMSVVGLRPNFEIRAANVPNAAAVILKSKRYILYNPDFMNAINAVSGSDWAGISILAHEIGHHLNGHTLETGGSRPDVELEADEFSGFVLFKLGASLSDAQAAMAVAASQKGSHTHPPRAERLEAIETGWNNASNQTGGRHDVAIKSSQNIQKPAPVRTTTSTESALAEKYIAFDVEFDADRQGSYFITTRGNLVQVDGSDIYLIGRLAESNKRGYRLMISDKNYNYLYIGRNGQIVNGAGTKVGLISKRS
jgi:hypothetical protein